MTYINARRILIFILNIYIFVSLPQYTTTYKEATENQQAELPDKTDAALPADFRGRICGHDEPAHRALYFFNRRINSPIQSTKDVEPMMISQSTILSGVTLKNSPPTVTMAI